MGISYSKAWNTLHMAEKARQILEVYDQMKEEINVLTEKYLPDI
jgi:molybdenum-dependent DNA-binding transcriptional regulator ModE